MLLRDNVRIAETQKGLTIIVSLTTRMVPCYPCGDGGIPILDLTECAAQQGTNYAIGCPFVTKLMRQCVKIDKKFMQQGVKIDKKIMQRGIMSKETV